MHQRCPPSTPQIDIRHLKNIINKNTGTRLHRAQATYLSFFLQEKYSDNMLKLAAHHEPNDLEHSAKTTWIMVCKKVSIKLSD